MTGGRTWVVPVTDGPAALAAIVGAAARDGIALHDAGMRRPTLDDVFLQLTGHAAEEIAVYARSRKPGLIVMGTRGHSALANAVLGSVAQGVLARCTMPMLLIH